MRSLQLLQAHHEAIHETTLRYRVCDVCVFGSMLHAQLRKSPGRIG